MQDYWGHDPEQLVTLLYRLLLGRDPDAGGLAAHVETLRANRLTAQELAREFVRSSEFTGRPSLAPHEVRVRRMDCEFVLPAGASVVGEIDSDDGYEPWVLPYFLDCCRPGMTVVDIGASWGAFALPAARRVGEHGRVFAFEVSARNCRVLVKSAQASGLGNVEVLPLGVSDRLGRELLRRQAVTNNNAINTGENPTADHLDNYDVVAVTPLDLLRGALGQVHILKMDIEGMEYRASIGALSFLKEQRPLTFIEYSPDFQRISSGVAGADLLNLYLELGYQIEILHRGRPRELLAKGASGDLIQQVDAVWREHVETDGGTHLDLCLHPSEAAR